VPEGDQFTDIKVRDWCWYMLGEYEKNCHFGSATITSTVKLQPRWSWPCKVLEVRKKQVMVHSLGDPKEAPRLVPKKQARVIPTDIPRSLAHKNIKNIRREAPMIPVEHRVVTPRGDVSMDKVIQVARSERDKTYRDVRSVMFADLTSGQGTDLIEIDLGLRQDTMGLELGDEGDIEMVYLVVTLGIS